MATTASEINLWRTRFNNANDRIRQLEELNKVLAAEVDAQRPLVDAACKWSDDYDDGADDDLLLTEVTEYYGRKAAYQASKPK